MSALKAFQASRAVSLPVQWQNARFRACKNLQSPSSHNTCTMA